MRLPLNREYMSSDTHANIPVAGNHVSAGFPSPADDYIEKRLDLNEHLVKRPAATFFMRVSGDSMIGAGIHNGDILIVDRSLRPRNGSVIIAIVDGELTIKRLVKKKGRWFLAPENDAYPDMEIRNFSDFETWGVVRHSIHEVV